MTSSFTYDALGRKLSQSDADSGTTTFTYNAAGEVLTQKDAKNQTITLSYDALGRKWQRVANGTGSDWSGTITDRWYYDTASNGIGQLAQETHVGTGDANLTRTLIYDGYGRLYQRQHVIAGSGTYTSAPRGHERPAGSGLYFRIKRSFESSKNPGQSLRFPHEFHVRSAI